MTSVFGREPLKCLVFDWTKHKINSTSPLKRGEGCKFDEAHPDDGGEIIKPGVQFIRRKEVGGSKAIVVSFNEPFGKHRFKFFYIPYNYGDSVHAPPFMRSRYPIAILPRVSKDGFISFVIVDLCRIKLIGEIPSEPEMRNAGAYLSIDLEKDVITATGSNVDWVMTMDFSSYVNKLIADGAWKRGEYVFKFASSAESVGCGRLGELAKIVK